MSLILWIIIGIILILFIATMLWIIFIFIKHSKRDYNLYKSVAKSVFSRKLSLAIIVIFYMISFGLVGGLTSALGRLNVETTDYIKENHLHQGVAKKTRFPHNDLTYHNFDQKTFYLATQGVIDFYNDNLNSNPDPESETHFLDMLGGQATKSSPDDGPTKKERLDGSNSPLSYKNNSRRLGDDETAYGHNFSIQDIGFFWNTWYYGTENFTSDEDYVDQTGTYETYHWAEYRYNGKIFDYTLSKGGHQDDEIVKKVESFLNSTIFYDHNNLIPTNDWTFDGAVENPANGLDTFSEIVYVFFDNDVNKYLATTGTFFFEYYLDLYFDQNDLFASSDVYEYQKTVLGTDFLLQSYNKNQINNEKSIINNPGTDESGEYAIDTVTFYNNNGKETSGPDANNEFFDPHDGSKDDPYQIYVSTEYYDTHNLSANVGEINKLLTYNGPDNNGLYYEVKGSYRSPTYSFPMQTIYDSLQNPKDNAAILINTQSLLRLTRGVEYSTTNYEFFGFSNIYDATTRAANWYFPASDDPIVSDTYYRPYVNSYAYYINSFYGDSSWSGLNLGSADDLEAPLTFDLWTENISDLDSLISYRSFTIIREIYTDRILYIVIMGIFLVITIIVLILLVRKRIQDSNKQLGTIKALGYSPGRIASAYTIFPIIIIIMGGFLALIVAVPLSLWFTSLYCAFFSLNLSVPYVGWVLWFKIFVVPLVISMFLGYWMAYRTIRRPTLDLLNNVGKDKPNWLVRGITPLIPSFATFGFTYKAKGIGRAFGKSLLLFCAILGSMSITSFAFSSSTMTATMTKQVFDIIDYNSKQWEYGAPFIDDININDEGVIDDETGEYIGMEAFDLFSNLKSTDSLSPGLPPDLKLLIYLKDVLLTPEDALCSFQELYDKQYPDGFDFKFEIDFEDESGLQMSPEVISNYYITWETAVALWVTDLALHVPVEEGNGYNADLGAPIINDNGITFNMLDPILRNYAVNLSSNIVIRYGKDATFTAMNFIYKLTDDFKNQESNELVNDLEVMWDWLSAHSVTNLTKEISSAIENEYIFNDIVFNKNYYDGDDFSEDGEAIKEDVNQSMTTNLGAFYLKTDLRGNLVPDENAEFHKTSTYMEGYASATELEATNNIGATANEHVDVDKDDLDDNVVNVAMTEAEFKELKRYKKATPLINSGLEENQARVLVRTTIWDSGDEKDNDKKSYKPMYIPITFDVVPYDSIYPLGTFFLQEDLDAAINSSLATLTELADIDIDNLIAKNPQLAGYEDFIEQELEIAPVAEYEHNYSVTYNIDTNGDDFITPPFSVALSEAGLTAAINDNSEVPIPLEEIPLEYMVNNAYSPFSIPLSIDIIVNQGSRVYELLQGIFYTVAFFALFIGITIVMIAMKDITDSNKREVSMFKAFGYSNARATSLVITPYLFVILFAFVVAVPVSLAFLSAIGMILTLSMGTTFVFALVLWQWILVIGFIICLVIFLGIAGYESYAHTNALEAISETNE